MNLSSQKEKKEATCIGSTAMMVCSRLRGNSFPLNTMDLRTKRDSVLREAAMHNLRCASCKVEGC